MVHIATRSESVRLTADVSDFTTGMAQAAAATALLRNQLDGLDRTRININGNINQQLGSMSQSANRADQSINQLTGRLAAFADAALILGPGLIPIGAVGVQAIGGLTAAATAAAMAGGAAIVAFQGVGDAIGAIDDYQLEPTVANLEKAREAVEGLSPAAVSFVSEFQKFQPVLTGLRDAAAQGLFPGLTASLDDFEAAAPRIERLLRVSGRAAGDLAEDFAGALASDKWRPFIKFMKDEIPDAMGSLSRIMGDLTHGLAAMFQAADPGNDRFLSWLEDVATGFDNWASSSQGREDIEAFLEYARETGPDVAELFSSLVDALSGLVEAAAPLGGPVLDGLTAAADVIGAIANSDLGTPLLAGVVALRLYTRGAALAAAAQARFTASIASSVAQTNALTAAQRAALAAAPAHLRGALTAPRPQDIAAARRAQMLQIGAMGAGLGLAASGVADEIGLMNTAMLSMAGPIGAAVGLLIDFTQYTNGVQDAQANMNAVLESSVSTFADVAEAQRKLSDARAEYTASFGSVEALGNSLANDPVSTMMESWRLGFDALDGNLGTLENAAGLTKAFSGETEVLGRNLMVLAQNMGDTTPITMEDLLDPDTERVQGILENLTPALSQMGIELDDLAGMSVPELAALANDLQGMNRELANSNGLLQGFVANMSAVMDILTERSDWRAYQAAIDDATASLKENGKTLNTNTAAGRANEAALDGIVASGLKVAEGMKGLERRDFLKSLRQSVRETADSFDAPPRKIRELMDALNNLGRQKPKPQVDLDDRSATAKEKKIRGMLEKLGVFKSTPTADLRDLASPKARGIVGLISSIRDKTVTIAVNEVRTTTIRTLRSGAQSGAAGFASGGWTGSGGKYEPAGIVHRGEVVLPQNVVQSDARFLRSRYGFLPGMSNLPGYAAGGRVGASSSGEPFGSGGYQDVLTMGLGNYQDVLTMGLGGLGNSANEVSAALLRLSRLSEKELKQRDRALSKAIRLEERELRRDERAEQRERRETDVLRQRVDMLRQERDAIRDSIASRFQTNPFAEQNLAEGEKPKTIENLLGGDIRAGAEMIRLIQQLSDKGLDGDALRYLLENASQDQIRAYATGSMANVQNYENLFNMRAGIATQAGLVGADAEGVGPKLAAAQVVYEAQLVVQRAAVTEARAATRELRELNKRQDRLERAQQIRDNRREQNADRRAEKQSKDTGDRVGAAMNDAAVKGNKNRVPR